MAFDITSYILGKKSAGGGGGGGSSDFTTAEVTATYECPSPYEFADLSELSCEFVAEDEWTSFGYMGYGEYYFPLSELGTATQMHIPLYKTYKTKISGSVITTDNAVLRIATEQCQVVSGDAVISDNDNILIYGDCELRIVSIIV